MSTICLFEDTCVSNFYPLTDTRHVAELRSGCFTFVDRTRRVLAPDLVVLSSSRPVARHFRSVVTSPSLDGPSEVLLVNALAYVDSRLAERLRNEGTWVILASGRVVAARVPIAEVREVLADTTRWLDMVAESMSDVRHDDSVKLFASIWDLIASNGDTISADAELRSMDREGVVDPSARLLNEMAIHLGRGSSVGAGCVLDASNGPIVVESGARIMHGAVLLGPVVVGENTVIKIGAKVYPGTTIGPHCKVGGEVEDSILLGYSNKQHDGFLGHSYLGEWVNLGADTNTSDLKNNYGSIRINLDGREVDTGVMFLGSLIGDHVKTGINTMLNTGTVIGVGANVFGAGFPPKAIDRFAWGTDGERFDVDRAVDLARVVMARRSVQLKPEDETLLRYLHSPGGNFPSSQ